MDNLSIQEQLNMVYDGYVEYLLQKYGVVQGSYFLKENCKSKNKKIIRTNEGLNIHHIDENKIVLLGNPNMASLFSFEYQLADRLVYANLLEHLLLHVKIAEEYGEESDTVGSVGTGGVIMIIRQINDYFGRLPEEPEGWRLNMFNAIRNQYEDYITVLKYILDSGCDSLNQYSQKELCLGWDGTLYDGIYKDLTSR